jgi:hypothetical protein
MPAAPLHPSFAAVISSTRNPVYAKQKLSPSRSRGWLFLRLLLAVFLFSSPCLPHADSLEDAARALARKVASSLQSTTVSCTNRNLASLGETSYSALISSFQDELQRHGVKIVAQQAAVKIVLTISKRPTDYLGVVQILRGDGAETIVESFDRIADANMGDSVPALKLRKELMFDQYQPILDIHSDDGFNHTLVLGLGDFSTFERRGDAWGLSESVHLPLAKIPERPLSGSLAMGVDDLAAHLAEQACVFSMLALDRAKWSCKPESRADPNSSTSSARIWGKKSPPWTSAASLESGGHWIFVISGQDGVSRLYEDGPNPVASFSGWGSEVASVQSSCGIGWQLLISSSSDWTSNDSVTGVEFRERVAVPGTNPVEFPGPVISLRSSLAVGKGPTMAIAIVRNLHTGKYEAYVLSIACSN